MMCKKHICSVYCVERKTGIFAYMFCRQILAARWQHLFAFTLKAILLLYFFLFVKKKQKNIKSWFNLHEQF